MKNNKIKEILWDMPYNKELSDKYGFTIYTYKKDNKTLYYVLEFGQWYYEEELNELSK